MKRFLVGLLAHHLVTKIVSLLLAIVLFVFVQQSISETQRIERLVIEFKLAPEVERQWVLLQDEVELRDVAVSGLRESLTREMAGLRSQRGFRISITIDAKFLKLHEPRNGIVIDAALCRQEGIPWQLGKDFQLQIDSPPTLRIEGRGERTFRPVLIPEEYAKLELPEGFNYELKQREVVFTKPDSIAISGPETALPPASTDDAALPLYVTIRRLEEDLRSVTSEAQSREAIPIQDIDWSRSKFDTDRLRFLTVEQPGPMSWEALADTLTFTVNVELRRTKVLVPLRLNLLIDVDGIDRDDLIELYEFAQPSGVSPLLMRPTDGYQTIAIDLEVAPQLASEMEMLRKYLRLMVDLTGRKPEEKQVEAPVTLIAVDGAPANLLGDVRLAAGEDKDPDPSFTFRRKTP